MEAIIQKELRLLLDAYGADYDVVTVSEEHSHYRANIDTTNAPLLIGKNGSILDALEILLRQIVFEKTGERVFFTVDIDNYRKQKDDKLFERIDIKIQNMLQDKLPEMRLWPMMPLMRRMIHTYIASKYPQITTESIGTSFEKVIVLKWK